MLDKTPDPAEKTNEEAETRLSERRAEIEMSLAVVSTLKPADRRFVAAVLMGHSLKDAYLYAKPDYVGPNARKLGWEWRQKPVVQAAIDEYFHQKEMTPRRSVALLSEKAEFDLTRYMRYVRDDSGRINDIWIDVEAIGQDGYGHVLVGTKYDRNGRLMIEFEKSLPALEDVMKYLGLFGPKGTEDDPVHQVQKITTVREDRDAGTRPDDDETE